MTESENTQENVVVEPTVESLTDELAQMKDQWLRSVAELENMRRRTQKEKEDAIKYAATHFARDMVSVVDNLRRALESCPKTEEMPDAIKSLIVGIEMTESELLTVFDRHGIKKIAPLHENFDPNYHQAMMEVETADYPTGTIVQVLQAGYVIHDRLLRPALVGVAKNTQGASTDDIS